MKEHSARQRARFLLEELIASRLDEGASRLPPIKELAAQAGVAQTTMWKAVRRLCDEGTLTAGPRRGIHVVAALSAPEQPDAAPPEARQKWQRLCNTIEADIVNGVYLPGSLLPPGQQLMERYGVCFQTLKKSLLSLVEHGALVSHKKSYRVPQPDVAPNRATVLFVNWVVGSEVMSALDTECSRAGIRLRILNLFPHDDLMVELRRVRRGASNDALLGYLVAITGGNKEQYHEVLSALAPSDKPIAVFDQTGGATGVQLPGGRALRVFSIANSELPGRAIGRHLLNLGHRHVAYFSPNHENIWSQRRLLGIEHAFGALGSDARVSALTSHHQRLPQGPGRGGLSRVDDIAEEFESSAVPIERYLGRAMNRMATELHWAVEWSAMEDALLPLMEQALKDRSITAWVGANDGIAMRCQEFLRAHGVRVPEDISVAGFDDSTAAFSVGLTSYNFNRAAAITAVVSYLVGGAAQRRHSVPRGAVEVEGFVTPRASTAPVQP